MLATSRLRCGPRNDGIAQKPQLRSQPSAIFTYAHGVRDAGRGKLSKSNDGTDCAVRASDGFLPNATAVAGAATPVSIATPNPAIWSASGRLARNSSPYRSAMQPVTTRRAPFLRRSLSAIIVSMLSLRASSMNAHVLTTTTSASDSSSVAVSPCASSVPTSFSESTSFLGQPSVSI